MPARKFFVVANPSSGTKRVGKKLNELVGFFESKPYKFEVFLTSKTKNGWTTVEEHFDKSFTDLVIIGGDGTINEAVNGLQFDRAVSIIPGGSGNDFVKMLDIGNSLEEQIRTIEQGKVIEVDVGLCNGRKFLNGVGIGFDGQIVANMVQNNTLIKGPLKYYAYVFQILASYRKRLFDFSADDKAFQKELILLCIGNGTTFGGSFRLTPNANVRDGLLDICEISNIPPIKRFLSIPKILSGTHDKLQEVTLYQARSMTVAENPGLEAHIDGEYFGKPPFKIKILPKGLKVRVKA